MNQFFNFNRFCLLVAKHWADNKKRYLLSILAFVGLLITWFVFTMLVNADDPMEKDIQQFTFLFALFAVGSFYASQYFRDLGSRAKGINFLLVPASAFEKILCSILFTFLLFFVIFIAAYSLVDGLMVAIANKIVPNDERKFISVFEAARLPFERTSAINVIPFFFSVQAVFLLGSVYFSKYSFLKTIISGFVIFFSIFFMVYLFYDQLLPPGRYTSALLNSYIVNNNEGDEHMVSIPVWMGQLLYYSLMYAIAPFAWIVTYFRLKEKQV